MEKKRILPSSYLSTADSTNYRFFFWGMANPYRQLTVALYTFKVIFGMLFNLMSVMIFWFMINVYFKYLRFLKTNRAKTCLFSETKKIQILNYLLPYSLDLYKIVSKLVVRLPLLGHAVLNCIISRTCILIWCYKAYSRGWTVSFVLLSPYWERIQATSYVIVLNSIWKALQQPWTLWSAFRYALE